VHQISLEQELKPEMYVSHRQDRRFFAVPRDLAIRTGGDPLSIAATVRREIWKVDKDLPVFRVRSGNQLLSETAAERRFIVFLLALFAALALIMAVVGIYGVMSYASARRTQEIRIRMALGARTRDVLMLLIGQGLSLTIVGVSIGLAGAFSLTRVMTGLLFGMTATDPSTFALVALLLTAIALLACYIPARRAARLADRLPSAWE
jgi:putative ABC transport system permease protein